MEPWLLIVLLGACALTAGLLVPKKNGTQDEGGRSVQNMQTALEQFMENMEAENREMVETSVRAAQQMREENAARDDRIASLERRCAELEQLALRTESRLEARIAALQTASAEAAAARRDAGTATADAQAPQLPPESPAAREASGIRARYPELFALHDAGRSVDLIAKKVGMNKGEVLLILQLSKQEEAQRV